MPRLPETCPVCNRAFVPTRTGQRYCSAACRAKAHRRTAPRESQTCSQCERPFIPTRKGQRYCSAECAHAANRPRFIALDGEGWTVPGEVQQRYTILASSAGDSLYDPAGIATTAAFRWLLETVRQPGAICVGYFFDYDVNQILRDLPVDALETLIRRKSVSWQPDPLDEGTVYAIRYVPRRLFRLARGYWRFQRDPAGKIVRRFRPYPDQSMTIYDVSGFFQMAFTKALDAWGLAVDERITAGKAARGGETFTEAQVNEIMTYNRLELDALVALMDKLALTLEQIGIRLTAWHGSGAIASALLKARHMQPHVQPIQQPQLAKLCGEAYFGGRIQAVRLGEFNTIYAADINSAYPAALSTLPSCQGHWTGYNVNISYQRYALTQMLDTFSPWSLVHINWLSVDLPFGPFPVRAASGAVSYPNAGQGWYWMPEVLSALTAIDRRSYFFTATIDRINEFQPDGDVDPLPWSWISELFTIRNQYKQAGDPRHIALKLGLNSLYGKLAERAHTDPDGDTRQPAWQNLMLAGLVTAITRGWLFSAAMTDPDSIVAFATDGIWSTRRLELPYEANRLGAFSDDVARDFFILRPGFYTSDHTTKTRGVGKHAVAPFWNSLRDAWRVDGVRATLSVDVETFITMRLAHMMNDWSSWRSWRTMAHQLTAMPSFGAVSATKGKTVRVYPPNASPSTASRPYRHGLILPDDSEENDRQLRLF